MEPISKTVTVGDSEFTVRELTIADMRAIYKGQEEVDSFASTLKIDGVTITDLAAICRVEIDAFEPFAPGQLAELVKEVKAINAPFFEATGKMRELMDAYLKNPALFVQSASET